MNEEHTASLPAERQRVEAAGATISQTADGKLRVGGIIQVTRCIGDNPLRHLGLTSEPELRHVPIGCARRRPPRSPRPRAPAVRACVHPCSTVTEARV